MVLTEIERKQWQEMLARSKRPEDWYLEDNSDGAEAARMPDRDNSSAGQAGGVGYVRSTQRPLREARHARARRWTEGD